jgi:hypothetical protein
VVRPCRWKDYITSNKYIDLISAVDFVELAVAGADITAVVEHRLVSVAGVQSRIVGRNRINEDKESEDPEPSPRKQNTE